MGGNKEPVKKPKCTNRMLHTSPERCRNRFIHCLDTNFFFKRLTLLSIVLAAIMVSLEGCSFAQEFMSIDPQLIESAPNNGTGQVSISWELPYNNYTIIEHILVISRIGDGTVVSEPFHWDDTTKGENSPLKGSYVWNVPLGTPPGRYSAELQISTREAGTVAGGVYWQFDVAEHQGSLEIIKFEDTNGNGLREPDERRLPGWQFEIISPSNDRKTYTTEADGSVKIPGVPVGTYKITEMEQPGYETTTSKTQDAYVAKDKIMSVEFGNRPVPPRIKIVKFHDLNQNRVQDANEPLIPGWEFSVQGPTSFTEVTDSGGMISKEVEPGSYTITEKAKQDWISTTPTSKSFTINLGQEKEAKFGNYKEPLARLSIVKFKDLNRNRVQDANEPLIPGWEFSVQGPISFTEITDSGGMISREVKGGTYTIREMMKQNWVSTTGEEISVTLAPGESKTVSFGNLGPQNIICFYDKNVNGVADSGEGMLDGWSFEIRGLTTTTTTTRTTDINGQININDLTPGEYTVTEVLPAPDQWYNTTPLSLTVNVPGEDIYFGNDMYRTLRIFKFNDANKNAIHDLNESALEGWEFQISSQDSGRVEDSITDHRGIATFPVRANVQYLVSESLRPRWRNTTDSKITVFIDPAEDVINEMFGNYLISIPQVQKDTVLKIVAFNDTNNNGAWDNAEKALPDRQFLISSNDLTMDSAELMTNDTGAAAYENMPDGYYTIEEQLPPNWCATTPTVIGESIKKGDGKTIEFGSRLCLPCTEVCCDYRFTPEKGNRTQRLNDENIVVRKSVDPYVLTPLDHDMNYGARINYTISVCARPRIGPTDLILAVDSSGSIVEDDENTLTNIDGGIASFIATMKKSPSTSLRIGLVSWDKDIDETVPPTTDYDQVLNASQRLMANYQELTMYHVGMNGSLAAFQSAPREEAKKVIVFITDARNEYEPFKDLPDKDQYTIHVLLVGRTQREETYSMLEETTSRYGGRLENVNTSSEIASSLRRLTATSLAADGAIEDIEVTDTLPSYLRLATRGTEKANVTNNADGVEWNTTTLKWNIPALEYGKCWSTTFTTKFCWKMQANMVQSGQSEISQVTYVDPAGTTRKSIKLPEGTIWLLPEDQNRGGSSEQGAASQPSPGFEGLASMLGLLSLAYVLKLQRKG